jgi:hypothetical protein
MEDSNDSEGGGVTPQLLSKRFLLLTEVRRGGMGVVQKAADLKTSQFAAIKRVRAISCAEEHRLVAKSRQSAGSTIRISSNFSW